MMSRSQYSQKIWTQRLCCLYLNSRGTAPPLYYHWSCRNLKEAIAIWVFQLGCVFLESPYKPPPTIKRKQSSKFRLNVNFCNKAIDFINLSQIINHPGVIQLLPPSFKHEPPMVVFDLVKSIRSCIFNHKKAVQELNVDSFLADSCIVPCFCADSPFIDADHGHIITGDLRIVENNKLRKLLAKGPKYR